MVEKTAHCLSPVREWCLVAVMVIAGLSVHVPLATHDLSEPDAARLANDAIVWQQTGRIHAATVDYRIRTSPLYLLALHWLLDAGVDANRLPRIMNLTNAVIGSFGLVAVHLFVRRLVGSSASLLTLVFLSSSPSYWLACQCGFPHLVAFVCMVMSFALLAPARSSRLRDFALICCGWIILSASYALKADFVLFAIGLPLTARIAGRSWTASFAMLTLPALAIGGVMLASRILLPELPPAHEFASSWHTSYPTRVAAFVRLDEIRYVVSAVGPALAIAALGALVTITFRGPPNAQLLCAAVACWFLPTVTFWGLRELNSVRHNMAPWLMPLAVLASFIVTRMQSTASRTVVVSALLIVNYAIGSQQVATEAIHPFSTRLWKQSERWAARTNYRHLRGRSFAQMDVRPHVGKVAINAGTNPYFLFECLTAGESQIDESGKNVSVKHRSGRIDRFRFEYCFDSHEASRLAREYQQNGWVVISLDFRISKTPVLRTTQE